MALGMEISQAEAKKASGDASAEEGRNFLAAEASGKGVKSVERASSVNVESNMNAEADEATEDGSF